jgi:hypothetical protein
LEQARRVKRRAAMRSALPLLGVVALATSGCFASTGPVIGYSPGNGVKLGWEVTGGYNLSPLIATAGVTVQQTSLPAEQADGDLRDEVPVDTGVRAWGVTPYLAWDPMLLVIGPRVGIGYSSVSGFGGLAGLSLGAPVYGGFWNNLPSTSLRCGQNNRSPYNWQASVAVRVNWWLPFRRSAPQAWDVDVAPKFGIQCVDLGGDLL